jgi:hypothetical protein
VAPATLYCLPFDFAQEVRQQGTSAILPTIFARRAKIVGKRKKEYRSAEGQSHAW